MIGNVTIGTMDVTHYVPKGGIKNLSFDVQNEDGVLVYPNVTVILSNLDGTFDSFRSNPPTDQLITITVQNGTNIYPLFRGVLAENGYKENVDAYTVELQVIHESVLIVNTLKQLNLSDIPIPSTQIYHIFIAETVDFNQFTNERTFYALNTFIKAIFQECGIALAKQNVGFDGDIYFGGALASNADADTLPKMSCYDFIAEVVTTFNCIWWMNNKGDLYFYRKQIRLKQIATENTPLAFDKPKKDTIEHSTDYKMTYSVQMKYANSEDLTKAGVGAVADAIISRTKIEGEISENDIKFLIPIQGTDVTTVRIPGERTKVAGYGEDYSNKWLSQSESNVSGYILRMSGLNFTNKRPIPMGTLLNDNYDIELKSGASLRWTQSLIDNYSFLQNYPPVYVMARVAGVPFHKNHIHKVVLDLDEETAHYETVLYS